MAEPFVIDGACHPYNFSEENLKGRFGRISNDVLHHAMFWAMKGQGLRQAASDSG